MDNNKTNSCYKLYLRYKKLYLDQINQVGGSNKFKLKIFDLTKKHKYKKGYLQDNLNELYGEYGSRFIVRYKINNKSKKNIIINIIVKLIKMKLVSGIEYFSMIYNIPHRTTYLIPLKIDFIDNIKMKLNNFSYIANIQKTDEISGTNMVKICLKINEILGAEKTILGDGTSVKCNDGSMDLSFLKLLESEATFYMKLGFDYELTGNEWMYIRFLSKDMLKDTIVTIITELRSIKISNIIEEYKKLLQLIETCTIENNKQNLQIILKDSDLTKSISNEESNQSYYTYYKKDPYSAIPDLFTECYEMLNILNESENSKHKYLYELMINLFKDKNECSKYLKLFMYLVESIRYKIIYGNNVIVRDYGIKFRLLQTLRHNYLYSYTF